MHTKHMQNVYKMYPTYRQTFAYILHANLKKTVAAKFFIQKVYKGLSKCWITFCTHFVYILYKSFSIRKKRHHQN